MQQFVTIYVNILNFFIHSNVTATLPDITWFISLPCGLSVTYKEMDESNTEKNIRGFFS